MLLNLPVEMDLLLEDISLVTGLAFFIEIFSCVLQTHNFFTIAELLFSQHLRSCPTTKVYNNIIITTTPSKLHLPHCHFKSTNFYYLLFTSHVNDAISIIKMSK